MALNNIYTTALLYLICITNELYLISGFKAILSSSRVSGRHPTSYQSSCMATSVYPKMPSVPSRNTISRICGDCTQMHLSSSGGDQNGGIRRPPPRRALKKVSSVLLAKHSPLIPEELLNIALVLLFSNTSRRERISVARKWINY